MGAHEPKRNFLVVAYSTCRNIENVYRFVEHVDRLVKQMHRFADRPAYIFGVV